MLALKPYIFTASPSWADLVEAANELRQQLGISRPAWIDACLGNGTLPSGDSRRANRR
jgi:replication initiation protein RepC